MTAIRKRRELSADSAAKIMKNVFFHDFKGRTVRSVQDSENTWLVLADALKAMCYSAGASHVVKRLHEADHKLCDIGAKNALVNCISADGLALITMFARKPEAKDFYTWATAEVFKEKGAKT